MIYIVICGTGDNLHIADRNPIDTSHEAVLQDLLSGQFDKPQSVIVWSLEAGAADVSRSFASELLRIAIGRFDKFQPDDGRLGFIEEHLGCRRANPVRA